MFSLAFLDLTVHNIQFWKGNQESESSEKKIGAPVVRFELTTLQAVDWMLQPLSSYWRFYGQQGEILIHYTPAIGFSIFLKNWPMEKFHSFLQSQSLKKK